MSQTASPSDPSSFDPYALGTALLRRLPPNLSHRLTILALRFGLAPTLAGDDDPVLATRVFGIDFANPVGLAAGFDKDAEAIDAILRLGFGFAEAGTVTPRPQAENPRPNLFRIPECKAMINRLGFPSRGLDAFAANFGGCRQGARGVMGANVGINRDSVAPADDFALGVARMAPVADFLTVNVSSPNTKGLRDWQARDRLAEVIDKALAARDAHAGAPRPPLLVKIAPDLDRNQLAAIAALALEKSIDGLILGNATVARPPEIGVENMKREGGLSGPVLFGPSTRLLADLYRLTEGRLPLIGCGGVSSGADAYAKIRAGASLVQLYTALVWHGPGLVRRIKRSLATRLKADGFAHVADAVGADHR